MAVEKVNQNCGEFSHHVSILFISDLYKSTLLKGLQQSDLVTTAFSSHVENDK